MSNPARLYFRAMKRTRPLPENMAYLVSLEPSERDGCRGCIPDAGVDSDLARL